MTMTVAMRPSSESSSSPWKGGLRGPRPQPLKVSSSSRGSSPASKPSTSSRKACAAPVIVYENTPKIVHARPQEFMAVVQRLTGKPANAPAATSSMLYAPASFSTAKAVEEGGDPLLLTLGQRQATPTAAPVLPSPMAAGGMLMSPSSIFSPDTMQSIQDLSPLF